MTVTNVKSGAEHACVDASTHVKGIKEGNALGNYEKMAGHKPDGTSTAARSTGVTATEPIDPGMPNLSPA
ncbi:MAG TPA: hypothetical protein VNY31_09800 [Solirubrobacteraceae bacterium]|jgi:hypothetical protein|nr:hypothetical protein [Solirubrobacteraceae bacterium]